MDTQSTKLIVTLSILLAVVVAVSLGILIWLPNNNAEAPELFIDQPGGQEVESGALPPGSSGFDLSALERQAYKVLNLVPIQNGLLPVKGPDATGKANPFL